MIECVRPGVTAEGARVVLFDFDGTLSLIRSGWVEVMVPMMVEVLADLRRGETLAEIQALVEDLVLRLNGKQTIYQMIALAEQVGQRGGVALDPLEYKRAYLARLHGRIADRLRELREGDCPPGKYLVPGVREWLEALRERGLRLYLASGTDEPCMRDEARLLDVERYFDGGLFGARDDYRSFSKALLIEGILARGECRGEELLAFGDGYVEIQNTKQAGGIAVGVATAEPECRVVDEWKRRRLLGVGADYIVPNFLGREELSGALFPS
jgi:phosphoglycolate phosphatase-like HAD superfamily hydrolase